MASFAVYFGGYATTATVQNGGYATNPNGYDIIFTSDAAGLVPLTFEMVAYDPVTGLGEWHVNAGTGASQVNSTTDAVIYCFVGNPNANTPQGSTTGTWASALKSVWHMGTASALSLLDSTVNANTASTSGGGPIAVAGQIQGGASFDGSNDYAATTNNMFDSIGSFTLSLWAYYRGPSSPAGVQGMLSCWRAGGNTQILTRIDEGVGNVQLFTFTTGQVGGSLGFTMPTDTWTHLRFSYDGSTLRGHKDNVVGVTTFAQSGNIRTSVNLPRMGGGDGGGNASEGDFFGYLDEVRFSVPFRSDDWMTAEYNNQKAGSTFLTLSQFESLGSVVKLNRGTRPHPFQPGLRR